MNWLVRHLRGHVLLFDRQPAATYSDSSGLRLLAIFVLLEIVIGPRFWLLGVSELPVPPPWIRVPVQLALALIAVRYLARVPFREIGFRAWRDWSTTEKSYLLQVFVLANVVFFMIFANRLRAVFSDPTLRATVWIVVATYLLWGFHQELMYRAILQTELVRRWGAVAGIVVSNLLYTFGPLHFYHFESGKLAMFAAIFAIGLFFGLLFRRSGNIWIVGLLHGVGDCYISGLGQLAK